MKGLNPLYLIGFLVLLVVAGVIMSGMGEFTFQAVANTDGEPKFNITINSCTMDARNQGKLSWDFDILVEEGKTSIPGQIVFQIINYLKPYSYHKYIFTHKTNLTREFHLDRVYTAGEVLNIPVVIDNVYRDHMYLPSTFFNYQFFYCQYGEELDSLKASGEIFNVIDNDCTRIFDFEHFYKDHMYSINQHKGVQCEYITRER